MKKLLFVVCAALISAPTLAASVIATPALRAPSGGTVRCYISNSSPTKEIQVEWGIYASDGSSQFSANSTLLPLHNSSSSSNPISLQSACVVTVLKGSKTNLRVSLAALDSSGNIVVILPGQ